MRTATEAIRAGLVPPPPELSKALIAMHGRLASTAGLQLRSCHSFTRYGGKDEGPILLIDGGLIEMLDEFDSIAGTACLAASRQGTWFRVIRKGQAGGDHQQKAHFEECDGKLTLTLQGLDDAPLALTWVYAECEWVLAVQRQYWA